MFRKNNKSNLSFLGRIGVAKAAISGNDVSKVVIGGGRMLK